MYAGELTQGNGLKFSLTEVSALAVRCYSGCHKVLSNVTFIMIIVKSFVSFSFL